MGQITLLVEIDIHEGKTDAHAVIVAFEIAAFIVVYRLARQDNATLKEAHLESS